MRWRLAILAISAIGISTDNEIDGKQKVTRSFISSKVRRYKRIATVRKNRIRVRIIREESDNSGLSLMQWVGTKGDVAR